jgi:hypothetical protein
MADGKEWTTENLNVEASPSYCYADAEQNCRRYGRLYTWEIGATTWTASENDPTTAPHYNFGQNGKALHRQREGEKRMAISVRCIRD